MCVGVEGWQGGGAGRYRGSCKSSETCHQMRVTATNNTNTMCVLAHIITLRKSMVPLSC
jgi:hypothetical protein